MGILDNKQRILDTILTTEGRRQLALGKLRIHYATFTDQDAFYEADIVSGAVDAADHPHLEAFCRPQDMITFESDDVGRLMQFKGASNDVAFGHVLVTSGSKYLNIASDNVRRSEQLGLISASVDNFTALHAITSDAVFGDDLFRLSSNEITFDVFDNMLGDVKGINLISVDDAASLLQDRRLSHAPNFMYLPPVNKPERGAAKAKQLGDYARLDQGELLDFETLIHELSHVQKRTITFPETSRDGNVFGQFFDLRSDVVAKLDIIDFGEFVAKDGLSRHVFFAGRLFTDSLGSSTYVNLFTFIFS